MKSFIKTIQVFAVAIVSATVFGSCNTDDDRSNIASSPYSNNKDNATEQVLSGTYNMRFPSIIVVNWPEKLNEKEITDKYEAYKKSITDVIDVNEDKPYKWTEVQAKQDTYKKLFSSFGNFEYSVKVCRNYHTPESIWFRAYPKDDKTGSIDFGEKQLICKLDIPSDVTCQLYFEFRSRENALPEMKAYSDQVKALFQNSLKDVFTNEYGTMTSSACVDCLNYANFTGDRSETVKRVQEICDAIEIPEVPADLKAKAKAAGVQNLLTIRVNGYNPKGNDRSISVASDKIYNTTLKAF